MPHSNAYIGIGSNLANRDDTIARALSIINDHQQINIRRVAPTIDSPALTQPNTPAQPPYRNTAAHLHTTLTPESLLAIMLDTERALGRIRTTDLRWEPRTIDLDLLLFDDTTLDNPGLTLPHPHMHTRHFVLQPLAQIAPDMTHPILKRTIAQLLAALPKPALILLVLVFSLLSPSTASAQQLDAATVLENAHRAYHAAPIAETIELQLRSSTGLQAQTITLSTHSNQTLLDLQTLRFLIEPDACTVEQTQSRRWITLRDDQQSGWQLLRQTFPPIPIMQLDLLAAPTPAHISHPSLGTISWTTPLQQDNTVTLEGAAQLASTITLLFDASTWLLRESTIRLTTPTGTLTILQHTTQLDPDTRDSFLDRASSITAGRNVESLDALEPAPGDITTNDPFPFMLLLHPDGRPDLSPVTTPTAYLFSRDALTDACQSTLDVLDEFDSLPTRFITINAQSNPLAQLASLSTTHGDTLRWSADPDTTIDRFAPDAQAVLVITDAQSILLLIHPVEGNPTPPATLRTLITDAIR